MNAKFGPIGESMGSRQPVKTFRVCVVRIALGSFAILRLAHPSIALDHASSNNTNATDKILDSPQKSLQAIPVSQIGAKAGADYKGDGLAVIPTAANARLRFVFQRLEEKLRAKVCG